MKRITKDILEFALERVLDFDLEEIYMFCAENCIENPYIANYLKKIKQIEYEESTNERENISQYCSDQTSNSLISVHQCHPWIGNADTTQYSKDS